MNCWQREVAMSSIDHNELFEQYYQNEYDFNTASLSLDEIAEIKMLAREKRVDYNLAPMGTGVFNWILKENSNIRFERVAFDSEKIDGMLYVPTTGKERAYIILNSKKPLINQIFTAAHEYYHYIKDYQKFKEMPYICDFSMLQDDIKNCMIIPFVDKASKTFDDCFVGEYRNVKIAISECEYSIKSNNSSTDILEGVVIKIDMNKNFDGITVIRPRKPGYRDKQDDLKRAKLNEVTLEDPEFDKKFIVYSTDQIEARYLITTSFMERFKAVEKAFDAKFAYCSFHGKSVYIAPHTGKDMFSLCSLVKPIYNKEQFEILFNEFASILALVDHFKLDKKLGL